MNKPAKAKPAFYSHCYMELLLTSVDHGYNLLIHGSMNRDMDLVAVPWINDPKTHLELLDAFCETLGVPVQRNGKGNPDYMHSVLPGGRDSYIINLNRGGKFNGYVDEQVYLDISFTPHRGEDILCECGNQQRIVMVLGLPDVCNYCRKFIKKEK